MDIGISSELISATDFEVLVNVVLAYDVCETTSVAVVDEAAVEVLVNVAVEVLVEVAAEDDVAGGASVARVLSALHCDNGVPKGQHPPSVQM